MRLDDLNKAGIEARIYVPAQSVEAYKAVMFPSDREYVFPEDGSLASYREVDMQGQPGTLAEKLGYVLKYNEKKGNYYLDFYSLYIDSLKVVGTVNAADMALMRILGEGLGLSYLDLSDAIFPSSAESINDATFENSGITGKLFSRCWDLHTLIMPASVRNYGEGVVANSGVSTLILPRLEGMKKEDLEETSVETLVICEEQKRPLEEAVGERKGLIDLYVPYSLNAAYSTDEGKQVFKNIYSPYLDNEVFRILSTHGYYNFSKLSLMKSTRDWFRESSIKHFDEFYTALNDTLLIDSCFYNCRQLESISLPATTTYIDNSAFKGCESLKVINVFCGFPPKLESENVFDDLPEDYVI